MASSSSAVGVRSTLAMSIARPSMSMGTNRASQLPEAEASAASRWVSATFTSTFSTVPTSIWPSLLESAITLDSVASPVAASPAVPAPEHAHRDNAIAKARARVMIFFMFLLLANNVYFIGQCPIKAESVVFPAVMELVQYLVAVLHKAC